MQAIEALQRLDRAVRFAGGGRHELELVIPVVQRGSIGPRPAMAVAAVSQGVDWDKSRLFITPEVPLVRHAPLQRGPLASPVSQGQAPAGREAALRERIARLEQELAELRANGS